MEQGNLVSVEDVLMKGPGNTVDEEKLLDIGKSDENCIMIEVDVSMNKLQAQQALMQI